jgi:hypothetical protein
VAADRTPTFCFLLIQDGRYDYAERTMASAKQMVPEPDHFVEIDDMAHEFGFAGAIAKGWRRVVETGADYVFHVEGDFTFNEPVPVRRMIALLERRPSLAQIVLKRQPWNREEKAVGGIVELHPDDFHQRTDRGDVFTEHRRFWSTNPAVYSAGFCHQGWPRVPESEGIFTHRLLEDPDVRFAFWGAKFDPPRVHHIGEHREGTGY